ncbi:SURF1 family protein [Roseovarius atlanticus]|uniref:SURF1 family protein n=1 Tax=Roseovarius atlanticus TaxID=1641875 RepID=UPI001C938BF8|nr:SURF1 family protein [Roseovarius atlanticus]MBY5987618.1 SURF1 family protein [Roseovarius atlanticus]MBY6123009.1 SURF1 family protein [Roseovarius atlanticus]MBY6147505.1 SURF1 family protein [Roseovarius atlanticus]
MLRKTVLPLIFGLAGAAVLIWLGVWQVQRLEWKEGILAQIETRIAAEPVALPDSFEPEADKYLPVSVKGQFGEGALRVLVSRKQVGAGYLVISPFETEGGRRILVDRGFIRQGDTLSDAPGGTLSVTGNLHWPDDRNSSTPENDVDGNTWFARDLGQMAEVLSTEPVLLVARTLSQPEDSVTPLPVDTAHIPNDHLQYAITWFSLAAIWLGMTAFYIFRGRGAAKGLDR